MSKHRAEQHDEHDQQLMRPDGQRYQAPESGDEQSSKGWAIAALALVVVVLMLLMATGAVPIFPR
jgi:hypothetical protein